MTRINAAIKPKELCDKMLLAEHREITRIPNTIKSGKAIIKNIPQNFTLNKGHVKFFYNKLEYLHNRYMMLHRECLHRGFNVQDKSDTFIDLPKHLYNYWSDKDFETRVLLKERINSKLIGKTNIKYHGENYSYKDIKIK